MKWGFIVFFLFLSCTVFEERKKCLCEDIDIENIKCNCEEMEEGGFVPYDKPPKLIGKYSFKYPKSTNKEGIVFVKVMVDRDGKVCKAEVLKGLSKEINDYVLKCVYSVKFEPAAQAGKPVCIWIALPVKFLMNRVIIK